MMMIIIIQNRPADLKKDPAESIQVKKRSSIRIRNQHLQLLTPIANKTHTTNNEVEMTSSIAPPPSSPHAYEYAGDSPASKILYPLVIELSIPEQRESALLELSKKREEFPDLAPILWHSFGTVSALIQEIVSIYPLLSPPALTAHASNRVCNALALLQCVASHSETRCLFLNAHIPLYLYPFLNTLSKNRPFEYLRLTSLGVIGALVKVRDYERQMIGMSSHIISSISRLDGRFGCD